MTPNAHLRARAFAAVLVVLLSSTFGCGHTAKSTPFVVRLGDRPPLAASERPALPAATIGVAVVTEGIGPSDGAPAALLLASIVEQRLARRGVDVVASRASGAGYRVVVASNPARTKSTIALVDSALRTPIQGTDLALTTFPSRAADDAVDEPLELRRCTADLSSGDLVLAKQATVTRAEQWRRAAHGRGRLAFSVVGPRQALENARSALADMPAWPNALRRADAIRRPARRTGTAPEVYTLDGGARDAPRVSVVTRLADGRDAIALAESIGNAESLSIRLSSTAPRFTVERATATVLPAGACTRVDLRYASGGGPKPAPAELADAIAIVQDAVARAIPKSGGDRPPIETFATGSAGAVAAAERAAWWTIAHKPHSSPLAESVTFVGLARASGAGESSPSAASGYDMELLGRLLARSLASIRARNLNVRKRIEPGEPELWALLGRPCGPAEETERDAGALATAALAMSLGRAEDGVVLEPWVTPDGVGLIGHAARRGGESDHAWGRRVGHVLSRAMLGPPPPVDAALAQSLAQTAEQPSAEPLGHLANFATGGRIGAWLPRGTARSLARLDRDVVVGRIRDLQRGPLRLAIVAPSEAVARRLARSVRDRLSPASVSLAHACDTAGATETTRRGLYSIESDASFAEVWIALPLTPSEAATVHIADHLAPIVGALDGPIARRLEPRGVVAGIDSRRVGPDRHAALVIRARTSADNAQAVLASLRRAIVSVGTRGMTARDLDRAARLTRHSALERRLHPRGRTIALFDGAKEPKTPSPAELRTFIRRVFRDERVIAVITRPPPPAVDDKP